MSKRRFRRKATKRGNTFAEKVNIVVDRKAEKKRFPVFDISSAIQAAGTIVDWTQIAQGDSEGQRDGSIIQPITLEFDYEVRMGTGDVTNMTRVMLIQWKQDSSAVLPTMGTIYEDAINTPPLSPYSFNKFPGNFRILYDRVHYLSDDSNVSVGRRVKLTQRNLPTKIKFNNTLNSGRNKIYLIFWSDSTVIPHPNIIYSGMLKYVDY